MNERRTPNRRKREADEVRPSAVSGIGCFSTLAMLCLTAIAVAYITNVLGC